MIEQAVAVELPLSPADVFTFVSDPRHWPQWRTRVKEVGPEDRAPFLAAQYTRLEGKREVAFDTTEWDPPSRVAFRDREGADVTIRFELARTDAGTRLVYTQRDRAALGAGRLRRWSGTLYGSIMKDEVKLLAECLGAKDVDVEGVASTDSAGPPFTEAVDYSTPPKGVFAYVADPRNLPQWRINGEDIAVEADWEEPSRGARFRVVAEDAKDPLWWEIVEFDPGRTVRFRSVTGDVMQDLRFTFEPIAIGTHATYTFDCETTSRGWNLFLRASTFGWLYAMEGELRRISRGLAAQRLAENA